ncbi:MAG: peptidylprolyl isomerase [Steroidobacteraceae bacterium]
MLEQARATRIERLKSAAAAWVSAPQRSIALPLAGMALGLILSGAALFHSANRPLEAVPPGYAALVNGQGILMSDLICEVQEELQKTFEEASPAERARVLHQMIDRELLVQRALVLDLPETTTEVRASMADAVSAQAAAPSLAEQPTEAALLSYYQKHRSRYQSYGSMTFRDVVLRVGGYANADQTFSQAEADAIEAVYQLRSGDSIDEVMAHFGFIDSGSGGQGSQLDFAARIHLGPRLYQIASSLSTGQVSDPVPMSDGVHVIVMQVRQPPMVEDFPAARAQVYSDYRQSLVKRADETNLEILRSQAQVLVVPGLAQ